MIYLVEDDNSIRELVAYTLNAVGLEAEGVDRPSLFWAACEKQMPDLVLLDIMLPEEDGLAVLKKLRQETETQHMPVMMLTAKGSEYDKVKGLDCGADDYMAKPFGMMELLARVKALLRRTSVLRPAKLVETKEHEILVTVADTGIGIAHQEQERIFERFYRVNRSRSKEIDGTGLGLSIVKHGAKLHHANITIESEVDQGTTIQLHFPKEI